MQEQWNRCKGEWSKSDFLVELKEIRRTKKLGRRSWMIRAQVAQKYDGDWDLANTICDGKLADPHGEGKVWKRNPDAPMSEVA